MKRIWCIGVACITVLAACRIKPSPAQKVLEGTHELRKITDSDYVVHSRDSVTFSWKTNQGTYVQSRLYWTLVHTRVDPRCKTPVIKFGWHAYNKEETPTIAMLMDEYVGDAFITLPVRRCYCTVQ